MKIFGNNENICLENIDSHLVGDGELSKIVTDHLWLDFDLGEDLSVVDTDNGSSHLGNNDHVSKMGLDNIGLLVDWAFLLLLAELLDQSHGLALQSSGELTPDVVKIKALVIKK